MINPDDVQVIVCTRTKDGPSCVAGSTTNTCSKCNEEVNVSPSTAEFLKTSDKHCMICCMQCAEDYLEKVKEPPKLKLIPGQIDEFIQGVHDEDERRTFNNPN